MIRFLPIALAVLALGACQKSATERPATTASQITAYREPHRPQFHFTPPAKWMNDPNGMVFYEGEYHLFYQHFPDSTVWGPMHWGHAVSTDLVRWEQLPIALYPDSLGLIFSGSAVIDWKNTSGFGVDGTPPMVPTDVWRSAMTVPRTLSLHRTPAGLRVYSTPVSELRLLRNATTTMQSQRVSGALSLRLPPGGQASQSEIDLEFLVRDGDSSDVAIEISNAAGEVFRMGFDQATRRFYSDRTKLPKAFSEKFAAAIHHAPRVATDSVVRMHLYIDRASVELFADGGATALTDIMFPSQDFTTLRLVVKGDPIRLRYATISALKSIWR